MHKMNIEIVRNASVVVGNTLHELVNLRSQYSRVFNRWGTSRLYFVFKAGEIIGSS